jgi:hypothetical protein
MIIRPGPSARLLITQPDHAALAGRIMREWFADGFPSSPRRAEILSAIDEHDNGWRDVDAAPLVDSATGNLVDFIHAPDDVRQAVWPRGVARLAHTPYAAALVAQHALEIYARYRAEPAWEPFFAEMEAARNRHLHRASVGIEDLRRDYLFVRAGDLISLTFCNGWHDQQIIDDRYAVRLHRDDIIVRPDPFAGRIIPIVIAAVEMPRTTTSTAAAQEAFRRGRQVQVLGTVRGGDGSRLLERHEAHPDVDAGT